MGEQRVHSETDSVAELSDAAETPDGKPRKIPFGAILIASVLLQTGLGAWVSIAQYDRLSGAKEHLTGMFQNDSPAETAATQFGQFLQIENIIVNPAGSNGQRYLMISVGFETNSSRVISELQDKDIVIKDTILKVLGQRTIADLTNIEKRNETKDAILASVNGVLRHGSVNRLYFTQYVLQ